jgi:predicted ferric reductase
MKRINYVFWGLLVLLSLLWLAADTLVPQPFSYFAFRTVFVQYSGVIAIAAMSVAMLLAMRTNALEPLMGGLDKCYRLHKWLGITALVVAIAHWWWAKGTKWMVGWGWLAKPERRRSGVETLGVIEAWMRDQRGLAESLGEWAFYLCAALIVLALLKRFPYHLFTKTHKLLAPAYLVLVYHSVILTKTEYWLQPVGLIMMLLLLGGSIAAIWVLAGRVGASRKVGGVIDSLTYYDDIEVLEGTIVLNEGWPGHAAGQFAFVTSSRKEGAHPYTIASAWNPEDRRITFITKALGDHTARLRDNLKTGMDVSVEGPYGCFDFDDDRSRQIWVGAGIGITPFIARLKELAREPGEKSIDLFHPTTDVDQRALDKLAADAAAAGVRLHVTIGGRDGRLDAASIRAAVPDWVSASVWFCGPYGFGDALRRDFVAQGLAPRDFHQELFQIR